MGQGTIDEVWFEVFKGEDGDHWWSFHRQVGGVINQMAGSTEGYKNWGDCVRAISTIRSKASEASILNYRRSKGEGDD